MPPVPPKRSAERATVTVYEDGPYLVRGDIQIRDQSGELIDSRRRTVALCRCGRSKLRPFCDGAHRTTRFRAPSTRETFASVTGEVPRDEPSPVAVGSTPGETWDAVEAAREAVRDVLIRDSRPGVRRADALLGAASALMEWQVDPPHRPQCEPSSRPAGREEALALITGALRAATRLTLGDPATADQVRSLLRDAATGLRAQRTPLRHAS